MRREAEPCSKRRTDARRRHLHQHLRSPGALVVGAVVFLALGASQLNVPISRHDGSIVR
jgi:hypothetical protein